MFAPLLWALYAQEAIGIPPFWYEQRRFETCVCQYEELFLLVMVEPFAKRCPCPHLSPLLQSRFDLFLMSCNSWLTVRLELLGGIMLICAGSFAVAGRHVLEGGAAGNVLSYALQITGM